MTPHYSTPVYCTTRKQWRVPTTEGWQYLEPNEQPDLNKAGRFAISYVVAYAIATGGAAGTPPDRPAVVSKNFVAVAVEGVAEETQVGGGGREELLTSATAAL